MVNKSATFTIGVTGKSIVITLMGSQNADAVQAIRREVESRLAMKRGPRDILVDLSGADVPDKAALMRSLEFLREVPFRRMAAFGGTPALMLLVNTLLKEGGPNDRLKVFRDQKLARMWLEYADNPVRAKLRQQKNRLRPPK